MLNMENAKDQFKRVMKDVFGDELPPGPDKYGVEMRGDLDEIKGGLSDKKSFDDIVKKHSKSGKSLEKIRKILKTQLYNGTKVEMEHTDDKKIAKEIAMDHLYEDLGYYQKLKKMEDNKEIIRGKFSRTSVVPPQKMKKPIGKIISKGKSENKEAATAANAGPFVGKAMFSEEKVEATEATTSGSVGGYETPSFLAKSSKPKDFGGRRKTQIPGGKFVSIKKRCKKFPYCNQGDIKALKLYENETLKKVIKDISRKFQISENTIKAILEYEMERNMNK